MPNLDKSGSAGTSDVFTRAANGRTASSYFTDGRWNRGGWATYPSKDELSISSPRGTSVDQMPPPPGGSSGLRR